MEFVSEAANGTRQINESPLKIIGSRRAHPCPLGDSLANPITIPLLLNDISQDHINSFFSDKHAKGVFLHTV